MINEIQKAIYTVLTGNSPLMAVLVAVYDNQPEVADPGLGSDFPYVTIGDDVVTLWDTDDWTGGNASVNIHIWSRGSGLKETKEIMALILTALNRVSFTITGYTNVDCQWVQDSAALDPDGKTRHGISEYRILLH